MKAFIERVFKAKKAKKEVKDKTTEVIVESIVETPQEVEEVNEEFPNFIDRTKKDQYAK